MVVGGRQSGSRWPGVQEGPGGYFPLVNSSASQVWGYILANASRLPYIVGGEVDMSYLGRSGSAEGDGQTVLGGGGVEPEELFLFLFLGERGWWCWWGWDGTD